MAPYKGNFSKTASTISALSKEELLEKWVKYFENIIFILGNRYVWNDDAKNASKFEFEFSRSLQLPSPAARFNNQADLERHHRSAKIIFWTTPIPPKRKVLFYFFVANKTALWRVKISCFFFKTKHWVIIKCDYKIVGKVNEKTSTLTLPGLLPLFLSLSRGSA